MWPKVLALGAVEGLGEAVELGLEAAQARHALAGVDAGADQDGVHLVEPLAQALLERRAALLWIVKGSVRRT